MSEVARAASHFPNAFVRFLPDCLEVGNERAFQRPGRFAGGEACAARALFERLLALRNDVGLLAEEYDPHSGRQLGNFPQAFSHLALINAAHSLSTWEGAARLRSQKSEPVQPESEAGAPAT